MFERSNTYFSVPTAAAVPTPPILFQHHSGAVLYWAALHDALRRRTATDPKGPVAPSEYIYKAVKGVVPEGASAHPLA